MHGHVKVKITLHRLLPKFRKTSHFHVQNKAAQEECVVDCLIWKMFFSEMLARNVTQKQLHNPLKTNPQIALFKDPVRTAL